MMNLERRRFVRHAIRPHSIFIYSNCSPVKGWVKDISEGGMAFEYINNNGGYEPGQEIRLILTGDAFAFYLSDIRCKIMYDIKVNVREHPFKETEIQRCGVQFEKLDPEMQEKLTILLSDKNVLQRSERNPEDA